jgi:thymidylate kinase
MRDDEAAAILVEFCGLPGAGKSLVAAALVDELRRRGIAARCGRAAVDPGVRRARRLPRKAAAAARAVAAEPTGTLRACVAVARSQRRPTDRAARALQWAATQGLFRAARRVPAVHVFDEGIVQALWSAGLRGDLGSALAALDAGATWLGPDVLAVVDVAPCIAARRLEGRASSHSRTERLSSAERPRELEAGDELLRGLVERWRRSAPPGAEIATIENADDRPRDAEVSRLADLVASAASRRRASAAERLGG